MASEYIALIPAYEPDANLLKVVKDMKAKGFEIVVVDDGSGREYEEHFLKASEDASVLTHNANKGKGAALRTGLAHIYKYKICGGAAPENVVVVTVDADGQHLAKDAFRIAVKAAACPGSLILGSRGLKENVPLRSRFGNTVTRYVFRLAAGTPVHDTQTGLRAFTADLIPDLLEIEGERYEYEINMLMTFARKGIPIIEEEIETVYLNGNKTSHFNTLRDSARIYKEILKFSASSFIGFLVDYGMYALLLALTAKFALANALIISNVGARIVSATVNYSINRRFVFNSNKSAGKSALQYFALAALILAGNTAILTALTSVLGVGSMIAKVLTEVILFSISWLVQRYVIFYNDEQKQAVMALPPGRNSASVCGAHRPAELRSRKPALRSAYVRTAYTNETTPEGGRK
ncbi:MAG: bifunctional glycosyltransferase family 2/GtrA family protein [Mogibacterium sp.]|nr:bifunctional glycosyltransferase family 2/GtrA family protein [Mogibacterium sp.]